MRVPAIPLLALVVACGGPASPPAPSVLLVTLDTTRPDFFSTYGWEGGETPGLDTLAAAGARFDLAISSSAVTPVSHATILTGTYQYRHGLRVLSAPSGDALGTDTETLTTHLARAGYRTGAVQSAFPVSSRFGFRNGFDHFDSLEGKLYDKHGKQGWNVKRYQRRSDKTVDRALEFAREGGEPFFLWVHLWDPHDSAKVPPEEFLAGLQPKRTGYERVPLYEREVVFMDRQLGRLIEGVEEVTQGELLVAVTADHGEGLDDGNERHGWAGHRVLYQEQIRVPLVIRAPGAVAGLEIDTLVSTVDLAPTILDYAGIEHDPEALDGRSLRPLLEGGSAPPRVVYADQVNAYDENAGMIQRRPEAAFLFVVIEWPWKLIYRPHMPAESELFHLGDDPLEERDRLAAEPEVTRGLLRLVAERRPWVLAAFPPEDLEGGGGGGSDGDVLAGLGYSEGIVRTDLEWTWACFEHGTPEGDPGRDGDRCRECREPLLPRTSWD